MESSTNLSQSKLQSGIQASKMSESPEIDNVQSEAVDDSNTLTETSSTASNFVNQLKDLKLQDEKDNIDVSQGFEKKLDKVANERLDHVTAYKHKDEVKVTRSNLLPSCV